MCWAGIVDDKLVGPLSSGRRRRDFRNYISFLNDHFVKLHHSIDPKARDELVLMQVNAPSHASKKHGESFIGSQWFYWKQTS